MGVLNTHIFPRRRNVDWFRVSKLLSKGNTQNATCASWKRSGSYRTLQIGTTHVLMWHRIEIGVPLKIWYAPRAAWRFHQNPFLSFYSGILSLIFLKFGGLNPWEKNLLSCKGMHFPLRLGLSCAFFCRKNGDETWYGPRRKQQQWLGVGPDFLLQYQARYPHLTKPNNPEIQSFFLDFCWKIDYISAQFDFKTAMAEHKVVALPPLKYFLAVKLSLKVRPLTPGVKGDWPLKILIGESVH